MEEKTVDETVENETAAEAVREESATTEKSAPTAKIDEDNLTRKILFCLCYLWGILFFIPLLVYKNDAEAKMHANRGLALLLLAIVGNVIFGILTVIPVLHVVFSIIAGIYSLALLILGIIGIVNVVTGSNYRLPIIENFNLIK